MTPVLKRFLLFLVAEVACLLLAGMLVVGIGMFEPDHPMFSFTVFGMMAIGLFNVLEFRGGREFYYIIMSVVVLYALTWFSHRSTPTTLRGLLWFGSLGGLTYIIWFLSRRPFVRRFPVGSFVIWTAGCVAFYLLIVGSNLAVFSSVWAADREIVLPYLEQSVRLGAVMGLGIGLGHDLAAFILSRWKGIPHG